MIGTTYPDKDFATARATAALHGIVLERIEDDRGAEIFIASRSALCRNFDTLAGFLEWLARVEARRV